MKHIHIQIKENAVATFSKKPSKKLLLLIKKLADEAEKVISKKFLLIFLLCAVLSSCESDEANLQEKKIGILKDANVISTSFNEPMKIQLKTESQFLVIGARKGKFPQLNIGDTLTGKFAGVELRYIQDRTGKWFIVR